MDLELGNSYLEVNLKKVGYNVDKIKAHIGQNCKLMPVLKANAAGMGLEQVGKFLTEECGIETVAVAQVYEAARLRQAGIKAAILVMGGVPYHNIPAAVEHDVQMPVYNNEFAALVNEEAKKQGKKAKLQVKIETGMNRIGVKPGKDLDMLLDFLKGLKRIEITGLYTHLVESQAQDKSFSHHQHNLFEQALEQFKNRGMDPEYIHVCNSAAAVWFKEAHYTHVRPGRLLYGFDPNADVKNRLGLEFPVKWFAFVTNLKEIEAGETAGYNRYFKAKRRTRIATLSVGYADGYNRNLVLKGGYVLVNGKRAPLLDMCMDQTFVDVTGIDGVKLNSRVTLLGRDGDEEITLSDFSELLGTAYVNAMSTIGERVKRIYIR